MESILALLIGALAIGTASLCVPKNQRRTPSGKKDISSAHQMERSETVIPIKRKKASSSKKTVRASAQSKKLRTAKGKTKTAAKAPASMRKPRKRKAS